MSTACASRRRSGRTSRACCWRSAAPIQNGKTSTSTRCAIERFGLNADFIKVNRLSWTNNLITGGGKDLADPEHTLHWNRDVQDYMKRFGERKVEGDALMTRPQAGRELCEAAILSYVDEDASRGSIGQLGASASRCVRPSTGCLASKGTPNEHRARCR